MNHDTGNPAGPDLTADAASPMETTLLSLWRRVLRRGADAALTPDEAALLLGCSVDTVRQVEPTRVRASQDEGGRLRISASITYTPDGVTETDTAEAQSLAQMWSELKAVRDQLDTSRAEEARLQSELEATEKALEYTKAEVANLWRVMTTRNLKQAARKAAEEAHEGPKVLDLNEQRTRIRMKVADVRELARRRKWPWGLVG